MAAVLKAWREAATLILVSARKGCETVKFIPASAVESRQLQTPKHLNGDNFDVLMLKRSGKSTFMPHLYVFPGGIADDADFSKEWYDMFGKVGNDVRTKLFNRVKGGNNGVSMFSRRRDPEFSFIPSEIAFRICAIRETFEESGVLLARRLKDLSPTASLNEQCPTFGSPFTSNVNHWRGKVEQNPFEFIQMCKELDIIPDVWSLYEWSNWLTPSHEMLTPRKRRYDTAFFICCINDKPEVSEDKRETVHSQWGSPLDILQEFKRGSGQAAPPQLYELSKFLNFGDINDLHQYAWSSSEKRVEQILPVRIQLSNAVLFVFPGDDLYPKEVDVYGEHKPISLDLTMEEINCKYPRKHRSFYVPDKDGVVKTCFTCTIKLKDGQLEPCFDILDMDSKL